MTISLPVQLVIHGSSEVCVRSTHAWGKPLISIRHILWSVRCHHFMHQQYPIWYCRREEYACSNLRVNACPTRVRWEKYVPLSLSGWTSKVVVSWWKKNNNGLDKSGERNLNHYNEMIETFLTFSVFGVQHNCFFWRNFKILRFGLMCWSLLRCSPNIFYHPQFIITQTIGLHLYFHLFIWPLSMHKL